MYLFKNILRMLYQLGVVICPQNTAVVEIQVITFPSSWIEFTSSSNQNQDNKAEETGLIEVAECLILFEEFIHNMNISVTSYSTSTCVTDSSRGEGLKTQSCHPNTEKMATSAPI
jgi:hypothetical protein